MEITGNGNHCGIVSSKLKFRKICIPASLASFFFNSIAQSAMCRYSATYCYLLDACHCNCLDQLVHKDIDKSFLEARANIFFVLLHELRIFGHLVTDEV